MTSFVLKFLTASAVAVAAVGYLSPSQAQQVYRIVGPDGKVTFSDQPPPVASNTKVTAGNAASGGGVATSSNGNELVATPPPEAALPAVTFALQIGRAHV